MQRTLGMLVALLITASAAVAQFRSPQVPVTGNALQSLFSAAGQTMNVATDQRAAQVFQSFSVGTPGAVSFAVHNVRGPEWALAVCDGPAPGAPLHEVLPGGAPPGWFTVVSYDPTPYRVTVTLFDALHTLQGSTTHLGLTSILQAFAVDALATGTLYSDDARNPAQQPRMLLYRGTGVFASDAWLCVEIDGDQDFDDAVYRLEFFAPTPTRRDSWSRVKQLFR